MRKTAYLLIVVILLLGAPVFAQGPFNDVPTDHWAYDAVNKLQKDGIIIGYPDGTFGGKRAMSRYEFATAIARMLPLLNPDLSNYATKSDVQAAIAGINVASVPDLSKFATKADVDAIKKLVDEFGDTIAALGVDVDALKRDVAALCARVDAVEAEQKRVRFTGDVNVFGVATTAEKDSPIDLDQRNLNSTEGEGGVANKNTLLRNVGVVKDFDLNIVGRVNKTTTAVATINYGDYLNYLGFVDDYVGGVRPTSNSNNALATDPFTGGTLSDAFFPYYLYISTGLGKGNVTVGRFPLQWTPYTLKKIDVDSYTSILKTDDGNYPVDGIKATCTFAGVDLALFAAKNNENDYLANGLTGQPTLAFSHLTTDQIGGHSVGGLVDPITQTAGARATFGTPWKGVIGLTYYQAWSEEAWSDGEDQDQARVYGGDLNIPIGKFGFVGSWTKSDALNNDLVPGSPSITDDDTAWDAKITGAFCQVAFGAGYKQIGRNFSAAGAWDKIGLWTNPTDVKGPYLDLAIPIARKLKVALNGEYLTVIENSDRSATPTFGVYRNDKIAKAEGDLKYGFSKCTSLNLGYEWVKFNPDDESNANIFNGVNSYTTIGVNHSLNANANLQVAYQFVNENPSDGGGSRGGIGVVQFGVSF